MHPHTFCDPIGGSTEGHSGCDRLCASAHFDTPLARFVASYRALPKASVAATARVTARMLAHPAHASRPHWEPHRRPQWPRPHA
eukprot:9471193-Pyramimonas_sp.AAC.1